MTLARRPAEKGGFSTLRPSRMGTKRAADPVTSRVYGTVMNRDRACIAHPLFGSACSGRAVWHHRRKVEHGGPSTVSNGVRLCHRHHDLVHRMQHLARELGLLLRRDDDPASVPVTLHDGRRVLLTESGEYEEVAG